MANGDNWRRVDDYHIRLYRDDKPTSYTICKVWVRGVLQYELWTGESKLAPKMLGMDSSAAPLKELVPEE